MRCGAFSFHCYTQADNGQVFRCDASGWTRIPSPWTEQTRSLRKALIENIFQHHLQLAFW
jgi:hypothetical protein